MVQSWLLSLRSKLVGPANGRAGVHALRVSGSSRPSHEAAGRGRGHAPGDSWDIAFRRLSSNSLTWEVAGYIDPQTLSPAWQYSVRRESEHPGVLHGATKFADRLDVEELLEVEQAARRAIEQHHWVVLRGPVEPPIPNGAHAPLQILVVNVELPEA